MKHSFTRSFLDADKCAICKRNSEMHGENASCESCGKVDILDIFPNVISVLNMALCNECIVKEKLALESIASNNDSNRIKQSTIEPELKHPEVLINGIDDKIRHIKTVIDCRQEFYNNECEAIVSIKAKIDNDSSITTPEAKRFEFAKIVQSNIINYQKALFELSEKQTELTNKMRANIVKFNDVIDGLRAKEREELHLKDISYNPVPVKPLNASIPIPKMSKTDKTIHTFAKYHNISFDDAKKRLGL
ncbi:MAG: hypothetical protein WB562_13455 [Candidatus Sulfotelmatobacter sp.]